MLGVRFIVLLGIFIETSPGVANLLSSIPAAVDEVLTVCPGESFSITCAHTNTGGQQTRWEISTSTTCIMPHDGSPSLPSCESFTASMISDSSGSSLTSTLEATGSDVRHIPFIACRAGGLMSSTLVGNITLRVIDSPPSVSKVGPIEYSVESVTTGRARFTVHSLGSLGSPVTYTGSVVGGSGSVEVTDNLITVTGLDYTQPHMVTVVAHSCPLVGTSNITVPLSFKITTPLLNLPTASIVCSISSLPIRVTWTVSPGVQTTNSSVFLNPPPTGTPTISYISTRGRSDSTSSDSPYLLTDTVRNDTYTFTVTVSNVAGQSTAESNEVLVDAFEVDQSSVTSSNSCLIVTLNQDCYENVTSGVFSIQLQYAFGACRDLGVSDYRTLLVQISTHSTCLPVSEGTGNFCYRATLLYQQGTVIDVETNLNYSSCSVAELQSFLSNGVTYDLDGLDSNTSVPHLTTATLSCASTSMDLQGPSNTSCIDGVWSSTEEWSCSRSTADWQTVVIIVIMLLVVYLLGTVCGVIVGHCWQKCVEALSYKKPWAIVVVIVLAFTFGIGFGILLYYFYNRNCNFWKSEQTKSSSPPPPDSLYADPTTIEHLTAASGVEYAMVDMKRKKEKKKVIEHETAPSGDTYAVVDKPKKESSEKEQPDVVPTAPKELNYIEVDVTSTTNNSELKPVPGHDELDISCVEYTTVEQEQLP